MKIVWNNFIWKRHLLKQITLHKGRDNGVIWGEFAQEQTSRMSDRIG